MATDCRCAATSSPRFGYATADVVLFGSAVSSIMLNTAELTQCYLVYTPHHTALILHLRLAEKAQRQESAVLMSDPAATAAFVQALLATEEGSLIDAFRRTPARERVLLARAIHTSLLLDGPTFSGGAPSSSAASSSAPARASQPSDDPAVKARPGVPRAASKHSPATVAVPRAAKLVTTPKATSLESTPTPGADSTFSTSELVAPTAFDLFGNIVVDVEGDSPTHDEPAASAAPPDVPRGPWERKGPVCNRPCSRNCGNRCPRRDNLGMSRSHEKHECKACRKLTNQGL